MFGVWNANVTGSMKSKEPMRGVVRGRFEGVEEVRC